MTKQPLVLIGGGGHCRSAIDVIEAAGKFSIHAILDLPEKKGTTILDYPVKGGEELIETFKQDECGFSITIGFIRNSNPRIKAYEKVRSSGGVLPVIVSPHAIISRSSVLGEGTMVFHNVLINSCVLAGINNIFNTGAVIEHDCRIGDHNHISTGAILNGNCIIGNRVFVGSGSVIKEGISITDDVVIGAGSVITKNISEPGIYFGNPARKHE